MYVIRRSSYYSSRKSSMLLFQALIMPTFSYAIEVWFCTTMTNRGSLELMLRQCARIALGDIGPRPKINNSRLYELANITPLQLYFEFKVGCLIYTILSIIRTNRTVWDYSNQMTTRLTCCVSRHHLLSNVLVLNVLVLRYLLGSKILE
jgi:hypothetical protein